MGRLAIKKLCACFARGLFSALFDTPLSWVLGFRPQKEINAKLGDGRIFHSGPSFARLRNGIAIQHFSLCG